MDYEQFSIKDFSFWKLYLHQNQFPYLGRCYAWANRSDAVEISDMTVSEREDLFEKVIPAWRRAIDGLCHPDKINLAILGNTSPHLHTHLIPRFQTPRQFGGIEFIDPNPAGNYAPYPKRELPMETLFAIRDKIRAEI